MLVHINMANYSSRILGLRVVIELFLVIIRIENSFETFAISIGMPGSSFGKLYVSIMARL